MAEESEEIDGKERRRKWLRKLLDEFLKLGPMFPVPNFLPDNEIPKWVENVEREFGATMFSVARIKEGVELNPKKVGALIGHACANGVLMMEVLGDLLETPVVESKIDLSKFSEEQLAAGAESIRKIVLVWYPALRRLAKRALCSVVDQSYDDMTAFLLAYSEAFSRKPDRKGLGNVGNSATGIYLFMLWHWRRIHAMRSVHELHQCLRRVLGSQQVGDLKRIEKLCQRIGLSYRKPGRPKKAG